MGGKTNLVKVKRFLYTNCVYSRTVICVFLLLLFHLLYFKNAVWVYVHNTVTAPILLDFWLLYLSHFRAFKRYRFEMCNLIKHLFRLFKYPPMSWLGEIWGFNQAWLDYFSSLGWVLAGFPISELPHIHTHRNASYCRYYWAPGGSSEHCLRASNLWPQQAFGEENKTGWLSQPLRL